MKLSSIKKLLLASLITFQVITVKANSCSGKGYDIVLPNGYDHTRYAPSPMERLYVGGAFIASVDGFDDDDNDGDSDLLAGPQWVAYHLKAYSGSTTSNNYAPGWDRPSKWYKAKIFDVEREYFQINKRIDDSYRGVGSTWNRGHLAQRADANRLSPEHGCMTHSFANAVPQAAKFNQGIWLGLENYIAGLANQKGELWIVTGPIYVDNSDVIGDRDQSGKHTEIPVAIPEALFKVVFWEEANELKSLSFVYPNKAEYSGYLTGRCSRDKLYDHRPFLTTLSDVENQTGLQFKTLSEGDRMMLASYKASSLPSISDQNKVGQCI